MALHRIRPKRIHTTMLGLSYFLSILFSTRFPITLPIPLTIMMYIANFISKAPAIIN